MPSTSAAPAPSFDWHGRYSPSTSLHEARKGGSLEVAHHHGTSVLYSLRTQYENLGDRQINQLVLRSVLEQGAQAHLITLGVPEWFLTAVTSSLPRRPPWPTAFKEVLQRLTCGECNVILLLKPGHLSRATGVRHRVVSSVKLAAFFVISHIGISIRQAGISLDIKHTGVPYWEAARARTLQMYGVRDIASYRWAVENNIPAAMQFPDFAFLDTLTPQWNATQSRIALSVRGDVYAENAQTMLEYAQRRAESSRRHLLVYGQVPNDVSWMRSRGLRVTDLSKESPTQVQTYLAPCVNVYTNRLHVAINALLAGVRPVLPELTHHKATRYFADWQLPYATIETDPSERERPLSRSENAAIARHKLRAQELVHALTE